MSKLKIHTAQNVLLEYQVADVGKRLLASVLDLLVVAVYFFLIYFILAVLFSLGNLFEDPSILLFIFVTLPALLYQPVCEYFWDGKTVGKAVMKMKVIRIDGDAPSMGDFVLRWLLRPIDVKLGYLLIFFIPREASSDEELVFMIWASFLMVFPLPVVGVVSMLRSPLGQRLGDRIANTTVIVNRRVFSLDDTILSVTKEDYQPVFLNVLKLRDKDFYIIKNALEDAEKTENLKHVFILAKKAKEILNIESDMHATALLKTIIKDYNHLAAQQDK